MLDDGFQHLQLARDLDIVIERRRALVSRRTLRAARRGHRHAARDLRLAIPRRCCADSRVFAFAGLADNEQFFDALAAAD